MASMTMKY